MNKIFKRLSAAAAVLVCLAATAPQAQSATGKIDDLSVITLTLKLQLQSPGFNGDNGKVCTFDKPVLQTLNTRNLLNRLAMDKKMQGLYDANTFPDGAKLGITAGHFVVVRNNNELIVDVSDIVSVSGGTNDIVSGATNNYTGLANPRTTELSLIRLNFDDTFIIGGSGLNFFVQGLNTTKTTDTQPGATSGHYTEQSTDHADNVVGEGASGGTPFVVTGNLQGHRNANLTYQPPVVN